MDDIEIQIKDMLADLLDRRMVLFEKVNLRPGDVVLDVQNELEGQRESELRIYFYRDGNIFDALEFSIYRQGKLVAAVDQTSKWLENALAEVIEGGLPTVLNAP